MRIRHLDTSIVVEHLRRRINIERKLIEYEEHLAISMPVLSELLFGVRRSSNPEKGRRELTRFLDGVLVIDFDVTCAEAYAEIRADLTVRGQLIGEMDMLIAAGAMAHQATLVTHNISHFNRIAGLELEDWQTPELSQS